MTTRIGFYHLTTSSLDQALPRLLEKVLKAGHKAVLMTGSPERVAHLDALLWTYDADSWLPHGAAQGGDAELQPILLTAADENPNGADVLVLTDGVTSAHLGTYARCINLFDGKDEIALQNARAQWREWSAAGQPLTYFQQTDRGGWQERMRINANEGET